MGTGSRQPLFGVFRQESGSVAVEFAIVFLVLLLLVFGIVDFGHAWYMKHQMSNASREGARYGTRFVKGGKDIRIVPQNLSPTISNYILNNSSANGGKGGVGLINMLPADSQPTVNVSGPGWTTTDPLALAGKDLTVTVSARKNWLVIGRLVPGLGSYRAMSVSTTMNCE